MSATIATDSPRAVAMPHRYLTEAPTGRHGMNCPWQDSTGWSFAVPRSPALVRPFPRCQESGLRPCGQMLGSSTSTSVTRGMREIAMVRHLEIRDLASLNRWRKELWSTASPQKLPTVQFVLQELSNEKNSSISGRAEALRNACGCASSGLFMSVTVVATVSSYFISGNGFSSIRLIDVFALIAMTVLAALCGKLAGVVWARVRLLRLAAQMHGTVLHAAQKSVSRQT